MRTILDKKTAPFRPAIDPKAHGSSLSRACARDHHARYAAGTTKTTSRNTVAQVAGAESADPKHPHEAVIPRATTDAIATINARMSAVATTEVCGRNQPPARYMPSSTSNGGKATAINATSGPGSPSEKFETTEARSSAWPNFKTPATISSAASASRAMRGMT